MPFDLYFGTELVLDKELYNETLLIAKAPESTIGIGSVQLFIVFDGVTYSSDNLLYRYKEYF